MRKHIIIRLITIILLTLTVLTFVSSLLQINFATQSFTRAATLQIDQIIEILDSNEIEIDILADDLKQDYLIRAHAASYMLQQNPDIIDDIEELKKVVNLLQIDEIHLFDKEGVIYAGTVPDYIGYSVYSGEQIGFFAPMLNDYDLELAQDVTPNTVEQKEMQYVAVWSEDRKHIVQIGIEPLRLIDAMEETELSFIFSRLAPSPGTIIFASDTTTGQIISSTDESIVGKSIYELFGSNFDIEDERRETIFTTIGDIEGQSLYKETGDITISLFETNSEIYAFAIENNIILAIMGIAIGLLVIVGIYILLNKVVLTNLFKLSDGMSEIAGGNLQYKLPVQGLPEFKKLTENVNFMVQSILDTTVRFSAILDYANIELAVYECRADRVIATSKIGDILGLSEADIKYLLSNKESFIKEIQKIMENPYENEEDTFTYEYNNIIKYLKVKIYSHNGNYWGVIIDATDDINEKINMKFERDVDFLTNIFNRRAFLEAIDKLTKTPEEIKKATLIMLDLDNLKFVNDNWGHEYGDRYISSAAQVLKDFDYDKKIIARFSGDEFVIMIYGAETEELLQYLIDTLERMFARAFILKPDGETYNVGISGGYAFYPEHSLNFKEILLLADQTMYEVKRDGKGRFKKYIPSDTTDK